MARLGNRWRGRLLSSAMGTRIYGALECLRSWWLSTRTGSYDREKSLNASVYRPIGLSLIYERLIYQTSQNGRPVIKAMFGFEDCRNWRRFKDGCIIFALVIVVVAIYGVSVKRKGKTSLIFNYDIIRIYCSFRSFITETQRIQSVYP